MTPKDDDATPQRNDEPPTPSDDEATTDVAAERPDWWRANERLRAEMDLPEYRPPRFSDGTYTHVVTEPLEAAHDCVIRFVGVNTRYPEDWAVRIDGEPAFGIGRHRDDGGNTVYELSAEEFRESLERALSAGTE